MRLLANGKPMTIDSDEADIVLEKLSRFTVVMMCMIASLEVFAMWEVVRKLLKDILKGLLRTTELG